MAIEMLSPDGKCGADFADALVHFQRAHAGACRFEEHLRVLRRALRDRIGPGHVAESDGISFHMNEATIEALHDVLLITFREVLLPHDRPIRPAGCVDHAWWRGRGRRGRVFTLRWVSPWWVYAQLRALVR